LTTYPATVKRAADTTLRPYSDGCPYYDLDGVSCNEAGGNGCPRIKTVRVIRVLCTLEKICDWGGDSRLCCLSCPRLNSCRFICPDAEDWITKGEKCPDAKVEVTGT